MDLLSSCLWPRARLRALPSALCPVLLPPVSAALPLPPALLCHCPQRPGRGADSHLTCWPRAGPSQHICLL